MQDEKIVELYFNRDEQAIAATSVKYNTYCMNIAMNILNNREDSEECVNDTWLAAWNSIPPHRPENLSAFLGKLTRNFSINRHKANHAERRGGGEFDLSLEELLIGLHLSEYCLELILPCLSVSFENLVDLVLKEYLFKRTIMPVVLQFIKSDLQLLAEQSFSVVGTIDEYIINREELWLMVDDNTGVR
jgi:hypothetical protein